MRFETTELVLAAALQTLGFIPDISKTPDNRFLFTFTKSIKLTSTLETLEAIKSDKNLVFLPQNEIPIINNNQEGSLN
jgi:hypothetical protein